MGVMARARVKRRLDGKRRLILPPNFCESAGFAPDERVEVTLANVGGTPGFIITKAGAGKDGRATDGEEDERRRKTKC
ncbi:MAG: hypothetical protein HFH23_09400 [Ruminococcus sp.]|nr:hypothetical protein [Ruminococcus sp.]